METISVYGLENCDTTKAAIKKIIADGSAVLFINVKNNALTKALLLNWFEQKQWDKLLNKKSTTWRNLETFTKEKVLTALDAAEIILANPTLLKRPVCIKNNCIVEM